jgi:hypothetical protein
MPANQRLSDGKTMDQLLTQNTKLSGKIRRSPENLRSRPAPVSRTLGSESLQLM